MKQTNDFGKINFKMILGILRKKLMIPINKNKKLIR